METVVEEAVTTQIRGPKVAVAVCKSQSNIQAVRWTLEKIVPPGGTLYLLHVQPRLRFIQTPLGQLPFDQANEKSKKQAIEQHCTDAYKILSKHVKLCEKKKVQSKIVRMDSDIVENALLQIVNELGITKLVLGSSSTCVLKKFFKQSRMSTLVAQGAPDFCAVMVVLNGRLASVRDAKHTMLASFDDFQGGNSDCNTSMCSELEELSQDVGSVTPSIESSIWSTSSSHNLVLQSGNVRSLLHHKNKSEASMPRDGIHVESCQTALMTETNLAYGFQNSGLSKIGGSMSSLDFNRSGLDLSSDTSQDYDELVSRLEKRRSSRNKANANVHADSDRECYQDIHEQGPLHFSLEDALEAALKDKDSAIRIAAEESKRRYEALIELADVKVEAEAFRLLATSAHDEAIFLKSKYQELLLISEKLRNDLLKESELRKNAEDMSKKDAISKQAIVTLLQRFCRTHTDYSFKELQTATNNFSEACKLGEGGYGRLYKCQLKHMDVAVRILPETFQSGQPQLWSEVERLGLVYHPHIVHILGVCKEKPCLVYEYMGNGSVEDHIMRTREAMPLPWYARFRIIFEVSTALVYLHNLLPEPIIHLNLKLSNILLDHVFISKLGDADCRHCVFGNLMSCNVSVCNEAMLNSPFAYMDPEYLRTGTFGPFTDIFALGIVILQMLTGKQPLGLAAVVEAAIENDTLRSLLDQSAGDWPLCETFELAKLGVKCAEPRQRDRPNLQADILVLLSKLYKIAQAACIAKAGHDRNNSLPSFFICPLSQVVMSDPHVAADGFTYDYSVIKEWLNQHDTSPMTNLKLDNKSLVRDSYLQSVILEWKGAKWRDVNNHPEKDAEGADMDRCMEKVSTPLKRRKLGTPELFLIEGNEISANSGQGDKSMGPLHGNLCLHPLLQIELLMPGGGLFDRVFAS